MAQHGRRQLTALVSAAGAGGTVRDATLAALGAAIAANSMPNIERYLTEAAELGVSHHELAEAVHLAHEVQGNAARIHARLTAKLLDGPPPAAQAAAAQAPAAQESAAAEQAGGCEETCPCHDEEDTPGAGAVSAKASADNVSLAGSLALDGAGDLCALAAAIAAQGVTLEQEALHGHMQELAALVRVSD